MHDHSSSGELIMNKQQLNELEKISNILSKELLSQNYDEANQMKFDKSLVINLVNLLNEIRGEQKYAIRWVPSEIGYKCDNETHKFFITINEKEYSYFLSNNDINTADISYLLQEICEFLVKRSLLEELKIDMFNNVSIAQHNSRISRSIL